MCPNECQMRQHAAKAIAAPSRCTRGGRPVLGRSDAAIADKLRLVGACTGRVRSDMDASLRRHSKLTSELRWASLTAGYLDPRVSRAEPTRAGARVSRRATALGPCVAVSFRIGGAAPRDIAGIFGMAAVSEDLDGRRVPPHNRAMVRLRIILLAALAAQLAGCSASFDPLPFRFPAATLVPIRMTTCPGRDQPSASATDCPPKAQ